MGKLTINGPFSIAMLNYQRVGHFANVCDRAMVWISPASVNSDFPGLTEVPGLGLKNPRNTKQI